MKITPKRFTTRGADPTEVTEVTVEGEDNGEEFRLLFQEFFGDIKLVLYLDGKRDFEITLPMQDESNKVVWNWMNRQFPEAVANDEPPLSYYK